MISRDNTFRNVSPQGLKNQCTQSSLSCPVSYLLVDHQVAHALCGCLSKLVVIRKDVIFNIWQGLLFDYLHPVLNSSQIKSIMRQAMTNLHCINCRQGKALKPISVCSTGACDMVHFLSNADYDVHIFPLSRGKSASLLFPFIF